MYSGNSSVLFQRSQISQSTTSLASMKRAQMREAKGLHQNEDDHGYSSTKHGVSNRFSHAIRQQAPSHFKAVEDEEYDEGNFTQQTQDKKQVDYRTGSKTYTKVVNKNHMRSQINFNDEAGNAPGHRKQPSTTKYSSTGGATSNSKRSEGTESKFSSGIGKGTVGSRIGGGL